MEIDTLMHGFVYTDDKTPQRDQSQEMVLDKEDAC
jgi:hypothetical protein